MACKYCKDENPTPLRSESGDWPGVVIIGRLLTLERTVSQWMESGITYQRMTLINYCPMCGRDLRGDDE